MNDHCGRGALLRCNFIFVGPTAVILHCLTLKHLLIQLRGVGRIRDLGIIDQHHDRLASHIQPFVVVPPVLWRYYAITNKGRRTYRKVFNRTVSTSELEARKSGWHICSEGSAGWLYRRRNGFIHCREQANKPEISTRLCCGFTPACS